MRKLLSILLLSIYVLGATEFHQLLKLPLLFEHYASFTQVHGNNTFGRFLEVHYVLPEPAKDLDHDQDMKLPFKAADNHCIGMTSFWLMPTNVYILRPITYILRNTFLLFDKHWNVSNFGTSIFQPPKI